MSAALELAGRALAHVAAAADEAEVSVHSERSGLARFAGSTQHQPTLVDDTVVTVRAVRDGRVGVAVTNRTGDDGLREVAARAADAAERVRADPDFPGLPEAAPAGDTVGYDDETAALGPAEQARLAASAIAATGDIPAYGFFTSGTTDLAVTSTTGLETSQRVTDATVVVLAAAEGLSGYATQTASAVSGVDPDACATEAAEKAARTTGAGELEAGACRAVLEPYALAEMLQYFAWDSFGALGLLEERSYLAGRIGERIFDEKVSIADDGLDARGLPKAFDFEGVAKQRVPLVENGVARGVVWDRRTAKRAGGDARTTGHAPPATWQAYGPLAFAISMAGGEADSVDELVSTVGDGIYVTRVHYLGIVDPRGGVLTGMTRDGTFRIRDGKIAEPLVNLRFTVAVPNMLANVPALSRRVTLVNQSDFYGERYPFGALVPAIATAHVNITGSGSTPGV
ncbi:MAG: TldD/PmbA family protein [Gaiellaceae bacterium]